MIIEIVQQSRSISIKLQLELKSKTNEITNQLYKNVFYCLWRERKQQVKEKERMCAKKLQLHFGEHINAILFF